MSNLLPKEKLQIELSRFKNRLLLVGALAFLVTAVLSALMLIPSHVALKIEYRNPEQQSADTAGATPAAITEQTSERNDLIRAQALLLYVQTFVSTTTSPTEAINAALALRPQDVRVERISFISGGNGTMTISGVSQARESISGYKDALSKSGRFNSATVPVGALIGTEGGKFTITLSGIL